MIFSAVLQLYLDLLSILVSRLALYAIKSRIRRNLMIYNNLAIAVKVISALHAYKGLTLDINARIVHKDILSITKKTVSHAII